MYRTHPFIDKLIEILNILTARLDSLRFLAGKKVFAVLQLLIYLQFSSKIQACTSQFASTCTDPCKIVKAN